MPATKIKISFGKIAVFDTGDVWGAGTWRIDAKIDGVQLGDPKKDHIVNAKDVVALDWSREVDVGDKGPSDKIEATLKVTEVDTLSNDVLGEVKVAFKFPFETELDHPLAPSGDDDRHFTVDVKMELLEGFSEAPPPVTDVPVGRGPEGDEGESTIIGDLVKPRVEICPVVPVMANDQMPPRPRVHGPGQTTAHGKPTPLSGNKDLNALANPSLIPVIAATAKDMASRAARIAITYYHPKNLDTSNLTWVVKSGPVKFHGTTKGKTEVLAYGTPTPGGKDVWAEIEVRWENAKGLLLATFRAYVGVVKGIPYRATVVAGTSAGTAPPLSNADVTPRATAADVQRHVRLANVLLYQSGLLLVPDLVASAYDGAAADATRRGIFTIQVKKEDNGVTVGVDTNIPPDALRLNFNPGVMHLVYVKKTKKSLAGSAVDRPGLSGDDVELDGTPSTSWISPTGVKPDGTADEVTMSTISRSKKRDRQSDKDFITARNNADKTRTLAIADFERLWGVIMPDYTGPNDVDWPQTVAHEVGHVLGLRHRGMTNFKKKTTGHGSADDVDDPNGKGHPWFENVMCYSGKRAQDLDLIQTKLIRTHPVAVHPIPRPPKPKPPPKPPKPAVDSKLKELQKLLGVPTTDTWDAATETAASNNMVRRGTRGPIVGWVQTRLNEAGMNSGTVDEISGNITVGAIRRYQDSQPSLSTDGVAGPRTLQSLAGA